MICLIDADILVYRVGFATEKSRFSEAQRQVANWMEKIMDKFDTIHYHLYLSDSEGNFRKQIDPNYKANRKDIKKPKYYEKIINDMLDNWDAEVAWGQEADDAMGIKQASQQHKDYPQTVICTIDKDLDQVAGLHYDFLKDKQYTITYEQGLKFFYTQVLTGDPVDNVCGLKGIGPAKAKFILSGCTTEPQLFQAAYNAYKRVHKDKADEEMLKNGQLVKIRQFPEQMWSFPNESRIS